MDCEKIRRFFHDERKRKREEKEEKKKVVSFYCNSTFTIVLFNKNTYTEGAHADNPSHHITAEVFIFTAMPMGSTTESDSGDGPTNERFSNL